VAFTEVIFQVEVFSVVTPSTVVIEYQRFKSPCYLHLQGEALDLKLGVFTALLVYSHDIQQLFVTKPSPIPNPSSWGLLVCDLV